MSDSQDQQRFHDDVPSAEQWSGGALQPFSYGYATLLRRRSRRPGLSRPTSGARKSLARKKLRRLRQISFSVCKLQSPGHESLWALFKHRTRRALTSAFGRRVDCSQRSACTMWAKEDSKRSACTMWAKEDKNEDEIANEKLISIRKSCTRMTMTMTI